MRVCVNVCVLIGMCVHNNDDLFVAQVLLGRLRRKQEEVRRQQFQQEDRILTEATKWEKIKRLEKLGDDIRRCVSSLSNPVDINSELP